MECPGCGSDDIECLVGGNYICHNCIRTFHQDEYYLIKRELMKREELL